MLKAFLQEEKDKLAGIEEGAQVNPSASEIKTDYESNTDTNAFTDAEKTKLSNLSPVALDDRILIRRTTNQDFDETESQIDFDTTIYNTGMTMTGGVVTVANDGYYAGHMEFYVNESGDPDVWVWIECKPASTGVWQLCGGSAMRIHFHYDGGTSVALNGNFEFSAGDEIRLKIRTDGGGDTGKLEVKTKAVGLGTITQWPASLTIYKIGEKA